MFLADVLQPVSALLPISLSRMSLAFPNALPNREAPLNTPKTAMTAFIKFAELTLLRR
jgi:hypothetical protein